VHVQDTGIGLASDQLQRVFELFTRVRDTQYIGVDGLGVGLALARHLIEQHGGTITVSSKGEMRGSRFTVRLPLQEATLHGIPPRAMTSARRRVLVVDDHIDSTDTMALLLEALGHEAIVANDGASALRCAAEQPPDLILLDLGLPDLDGVEVARLLRLRPGGETLRIVALTGWGQPADRERTREAGFDLHFVKPLSREALETLVNTLAEAGPSISPPMLPPA
jgi:CheY-like chemotaxis protein